MCAVKGPLSPEKGCGWVGARGVGGRRGSRGPCTGPQDYCGQNSQGSFSIVTENVPCGTTGVTCSKAIKIFLGVSAA